MLADDSHVTDLTPLRYVRSITAPLSPLAARRFSDKFGVTVLNGYGQAEIGEVIGWTAADARDHPEKIGAVGRPHPASPSRWWERTGRCIRRQRRRVAGAATADGLGVRGRQSLDDRLDPEGYVHTGDFARIDEDGFVWIEGRVGDVINRGGNKVFPGQVEEVLLLSPACRTWRWWASPTNGSVRCRWPSSSVTRRTRNWIDSAGTIWWPTRSPSRSGT